MVNKYSFKIKDKKNLIVADYGFSSKEKLINSLSRYKLDSGDRVILKL